MEDNMPQDLGNKMNPVLAGLTGLGEGFLQGYLARRKMDEEQRQFNAEMALKERQYSFLGQFQQAQIENWRADNLRQVETAKANIQNQQYDNYLNTMREFDVIDATDTMPKNAIPADPNNSYLRGKFLIPKTTAVKPQEVLLGYGKIPNAPYAGEKYGHIDPVTKKEVITKFEEYKPESQKEEKDIYGDDLAKVEGYIQEIETLRKSPVKDVADPSGFFLVKDKTQKMIGNLNPATGKEVMLTPEEYDRTLVQPIKNKAKIYTSKLIRNSGLSQGISIIKGYMSKGKDLNEALRIFKEDNPNISEDDEKILASYFYLENL